jgi:Ribbon-helix-helix protein, copG family
VRTTLTLDPDVAERLRQEVHRRGTSTKALVNEALRAGLTMVAKPAKPKPFRVKPHSFGFRPGVDLDRLNQAVDELDSEAFAIRLRR